MDTFENCWFLYGIRINGVFLGYKKFHSSGSEVEVNFDYNEAKKPFVVGWLHTHIGMKNSRPSATDHRAMRSWVKAHYKPYICGIRCEDEEKYYCFYVNGTNDNNVTIVSQKKIKLHFLNSFFIALLN